MAKTLSLDLPPDDDPRRVELRAWIDEHPEPSPVELRDRGLIVPHWPAPWGLDAGPELQLIIEDELKRAGIRRPINPIGIGHCGPTIIVHGSQEQQDRYLPRMLTGEEMWCQLFSEPGAGSDLANLSTRALRDGDEYVVNGQKIWTSLAEAAAYGILIARTDPDTSKHTGISYFIIDMKSPGIEIRPIRNMTGGSGFNEVFFTDVRVPVAHRIGDENNGWAMAKQTLANERVTLSTGGGAQWGHGPSAADLVEYARRLDPVDDRLVRQQLMRVYTEGEILRYHRLRLVSAQLNKKPGPDASLRKALADPYGKRVFEAGLALHGAAGMLTDGGGKGAEVWANGFLFSPALTVGGGTTQVLSNIIAERLLGLPHDLDVDQGKSWAETRGNAG